MGPEGARRLGSLGLEAEPEHPPPVEDAEGRTRKEEGSRKTKGSCEKCRKSVMDVPLNGTWPEKTLVSVGDMSSLCFLQTSRSTLGSDKSLLAKTTAT